MIMNSYTVNIDRGQVTHNIPNELGLQAFKDIIGSIVLHLLEGKRKRFKITIDFDNEGKCDGSHTSTI